VPDRGLDLFQLAGAHGHAARQGRLFLQGAQRGPESAFELGALREIERFGSVGVAYATAEAEQIAIVHLVQHASAIRAGER
jgi:hypothetical protein